MKALVKESAGVGFALKNVAEPAIRENEVLIRVRRAGVCGTDVHIYEWDAWARGRCTPPFIVGHEFAGEVVQVGALVTDVDPNGPAAGRIQARDVILAVNRRPVADAAEAKRELGKVAAGHIAQILLWRSDGEVFVTVKKD